MVVEIVVVITKSVSKVHFSIHITAGANRKSVSYQLCHLSVEERLLQNFNTFDGNFTCLPLSLKVRSWWPLCSYVLTATQWQCIAGQCSAKAWQQSLCRIAPQPLSSFVLIYNYLMCGSVQGWTWVQWTSYMFLLLGYNTSCLPGVLDEIISLTHEKKIVADSCTNLSCATMFKWAVKDLDALFPWILSQRRKAE